MTTINRDNVYLYSRYRGTLEVHQGSITPFYRHGGRFTFTRHGKESHLHCPLEPGVVRHGVVWLAERDDKKAVELFIEHEKIAIQELEEKIERRRLKIKQLMEFA